MQIHDQTASSWKQSVEWTFVFFEYNLHLPQVRLLSSRAVKNDLESVIWRFADCRRRHDLNLHRTLYLPTALWEAWVTWSVNLKSLSTSTPPSGLSLSHTAFQVLAIHALSVVPRKLSSSNWHLMKSTSIFCLFPSEFYYHKIHLFLNNVLINQGKPLHASLGLWP